MTHTKKVSQKITNLGLAKLVHVHVISFINDENTSRKSCCTKIIIINFMYIAFDTCLQYIMKIHHELVLYIAILLPFANQKLNTLQHLKFAIK